MAVGREISPFSFLQYRRSLHLCCFPNFGLLIFLSFLSFLLCLNYVQNYGGSDFVVTRVPLCVSRVCVCPSSCGPFAAPGQARPARPDILTFYSVVGSIQKSKGNTNDAFIICVIMKRFVVLDLVVVVTWILPRQRQNNVTGKETMTTTTMEGGT